MADVVPFQPRDPEPVHDTSFEVALDDYLPPLPAVPVDPEPEPGALLPVIPVALQTLGGVKRELARYTGRQVHRAKYHGVRSPRYLLLTLTWAPIGVALLLGRWLRWCFAPVPPSVHADAVQEGYRAWRSVFGLHLKVTKSRSIRSAAVGGAAAIGLLVLWFAGPRWVLIPIGVVMLSLFARLGRPKDRPILRPATITPRFRVLNADVVLRAYYAAKLGDPEKPGMQVTFGSPMRRDGEGSGVDVDLPYGLGLADAIKARDGLASGLDVQVSQVFLHRDPTSNRRHHLWVADRDPLAVPVGRTPLLACRATDIWKPAPFGLDERGQLVAVPLMWNSVLVSALPRAGKTFSARTLGLFAALDPFVQLDVFDFKGSPDWRKFALVAESCAFGLTPTKDGLPGDIFRATLERLKGDVQDRYRRLSELADRRPDLCPEGKLTRKLARDPAFNMPVRVLILDEFQEIWDASEGVAKDIAGLLVSLVKVAPGAGLILIDATQRPSGVGSGTLGQQFTSFRDNHAIRFGLRTSSWQVSELCLGAGAYSEGLDTSQLLPQYKGVGILRGATDASPTVRTYLADGQDAEKILTAARGLREHAGTLSGYAAGVDVDTPARDIIADVLAVLGERPALHWQTIAEKLAQRFPDRWEGVTAESVSAECRGLGIPSVDVKYLGRTLMGCRREHLERLRR